MFYDRKRVIAVFAATMLCFTAIGCGEEKTSPTSLSTGSGSKNVSVSTQSSEITIASSVQIPEASAISLAKEVDYDNVSLKEECNSYFKLGCGINGSMLENLTTYDEQYMSMVKKHFDTVTLTNLMKSCYLLQQEPSQKSKDGMPVLDYTCIDDTLRWCQDNRIKMRGHTLVWHTQAPGWFFREGYKDEGEFVDKDTMLARMESYIKQVVTHCQENYPGVVYCWDVVNEAVEPDTGDKKSFFSCRTKTGDEINPWYATIGEDYVDAAFTYARKYADPDVKLFYNDYNAFQPQKRNYIFKLAEHLKEKGLIDGIGMQGYYGLDYPDISTITSAISLYASLDLELQITELSIGVDKETPEQFELQAKRYKDILGAVKSLDTEAGGTANITNVTFFGLKDHYVVNDKTNARLFDSECKPKPAFKAVFDVLKK